MLSRSLTGFLLLCSLSLFQQASVARDLRVGDPRSMPPAGFIDGRGDRNPGMSPHQAARIAQEQNGGGRVLAVDRNSNGYRVKLLKNGDVRIVYVPGS